MTIPHKSRFNTPVYEDNVKEAEKLDSNDKQIIFVMLTIMFALLFSSNCFVKHDLQLFLKYIGIFASAWLYLILKVIIDKMSLLMPVFTKAVLFLLFIVLLIAFGLIILINLHNVFGFRY